MIRSTDNRRQMRMFRQFDCFWQHHHSKSGPQEAVHLPAVIRNPRSVAGVIGIGMRTACEVTRQRLRTMRFAILVVKSEVGLFPTALGSQSNRWSKLRFSMVTTTTCSIPGEV